jgi:RNA polymerase sigma factor (sigma-70 family)
MIDTTDEQLLAAYRTGEREAFAVLVARHEGLVRAACLRQAPSADCEDCIQAVFLVLARRPAAAAQAPVLPAWLLRVASHVCRRAQRGARRRRQAERQAAQADGGGVSSRPEALDHLDDCLARLPERQRMAVSLQYLADKPADEVAAALGTSRDNAYQLVSRGLATLRALLTKRGIALSGPALLALLAAEGQAATASAGATTSLALSLSATPSAGAAKLATGATTAMTLTAPSTITMMAASLLLAAGVTSAVVTAEPAQVPTPGPVQPVPAPTVMDMILEQEMTVDFQDADLADAIEMLGMGSNLNPFVHPRAVDSPAISLTVERMRIRNILELIERATGSTHVIENGGYFILPAGEAKPVTRIDLTTADQRLRDRMEQKITFDFQDNSLAEVIGFLRQATGTNIVVMPAVSADWPTVNLKVSDMRVQDALHWLCGVIGASVRYADQALVIERVVSDGAIFVHAPSTPPNVIIQKVNGGILTWPTTHGK